MLVVTTCSTVALFGVCISPVNGALALFSTDLCGPTDDVVMLDILGTSNGQIFLAGRDGYLYELVYNVTNGPVCSLKCPYISFIERYAPFWGNSGAALLQLAIDEERRVIYALTSDSCIVVILFTFLCTVTVVDLFNH